MEGEEKKKKNCNKKLPHNLAKSVDIFSAQVKSQFKRESLLGLEKLEKCSKRIIPSHQIGTFS